ncbi:craniofacial development protein 2-like [Nilaparvata lugens]|uniref:craniofacial development protein 2-like n=1 Tax=Nilaparvata lugens TaxID=108931 RepID=UPI00193E0902|nr:craniofacial development protein 2-like [Nilaparvata lugens]
MHIGTWNVRTLLQAGKLENAKQEMKRNRLDVMGMCEMRWGGNGELVSGDYKLFYSGEEKQGQHGVGVLLGPRVKDKVRRVDYIDGRLMMVRLEGSEKDLVIVQTYMPTSQYDEEQVDQCYGRMEEIIEREARGASIMIMGDWNAVVGEGAEGTTVGGFGYGTRNERGTKMINFCKDKSFVVGNTLFDHPKRRRYTWTSSLDEERYQLDYILIQKRFRNCLKNAKTYPGADINSEHNLVVAEVEIKLKRVRGGKRVEKLNLELLQEEGKRNELVNRYSAKRKERKEEINEEWSNMSKCLKEAAKETVGITKSRRIRKEWINVDMLKKMEERRKWKNDKTDLGKRTYRKLDNELRRETDKARNKWLQERCLEI